jgi:hypothetical protein
MTDMTTNEVKTSAKKRAAKKRAAAPKPAPADGKFAGMTVRDCCDGCNEKACVISGKPYCAHPRKGGLHGPEMSDNAALLRRKQAETVLGKQKLTVK